MRPGHAQTLPLSFARVPATEQGAPPPLPTRAGSRQGVAGDGRPSPPKSRAPLPPPPPIPSDAAITHFSRETVERTRPVSATSVAKAGGPSGGRDRGAGGGSVGPSGPSNPTPNPNQNGEAGGMNSYRRLGALTAGFSNGSETLSSSIRTTQL